MPEPDTLLGALRQRVEADPDGRFCTFARRTISYGQFATLVARAAQTLSHHGVAPGSRVALMMRNHLEHLVAGYALRWLGAIHVPVSVHHKELGLRTQFEDVQPALVIADEPLIPLVKAALVELGPSPEVLTPAAVVEGAPAFASFSADRKALAWPESDLDDIALIAYTSGTSGPPKGAMLSERFLELGRRTAAELAGVEPGDVLFLWEPFHHMAGWISVHMSIAHGVPLAMVERFSASRCWDQVRASGATKLHYLGGVIDLLLAQPPSPRDRDHRVSVVWGAAAPAARWRQFEKRFGVELREGYGLSEAANFATVNIGGPVGSIGRPVEGFEAWITEPGTTNELAAGTVGEIVLRPLDRRVVMHGYYNDPERSASVLSEDGTVRTGDLGYMDQDGWFFYSGRAKDSLRRRGENVSAWEVERIVNAFDGVMDSAVVGVDTAIGEQDIKVVVAVAPGESFDPAALIRWCRDNLAYYQVPRYVQIVDELPYGPTQRVQKQHLSRDTTSCFDAERERSLTSHHPGPEVGH
jgi:carnitine-CoA ligase